MDVVRLIEALSNPALYAHAAARVEVRQTHISVVVLAGDYVYKFKKPVDLGFLDFSTLEKRYNYCRQEVVLNRRLAADVYLGVVPLIETGRGLVLGQENAETQPDQGEVVEWCVKMRRLPDDATFLKGVERGEVGVEMVELLAQRIAAFHQQAETNPRIASFGRSEGAAHIILDIFAQARSHIGTTVSAAVYSRVKSLEEQALARLGSLIDARADRGVPRDCHGDLHLDHIYCFPERGAPADLVIIDCIEFNERFRFTDPVADMAFAYMDFAFHSRRDLALAFAESYFRATKDDEGRILLPLYAAYRATVRGMVDGLMFMEKEVSETARRAALRGAHAHWLLALTELEEPSRKPCILLVSGLPGTGKSTLSAKLADAAGFDVIRSDQVRKELAGVPVHDPLPPSYYSAEWIDRTYAECLKRAEQLLLEGKRVLVDATFREEGQRRRFLDAAAHWGVPGFLLICEVGPETVQRRLSARKNDASDADWTIYQQIAEAWENLGSLTQNQSRSITMEANLEDALAAALVALRELGLISGGGGA